MQADTRSLLDHCAIALEIRVVFLANGSARVPPVPTVKLEDSIG